MINERPVDDPKLQQALNEIRTVMEKYDFPGAVMLVAPEEAVFSYKMDATWSALRRDRSLEMGFRFRAVSSETGKRETHRRIEGAMHTICQLSDYRRIEGAMHTICQLSDWTGRVLLPRVCHGRCLRRGCSHRQTV